MKFIDKCIAQSDFNPRAVLEKTVVSRIFKTTPYAFAERLSHYSAFDFREFKAALRNHHPEPSVQNVHLQPVFKNHVNRTFSPMLSRFMVPVTNLRPNRQLSVLYIPTI